MSLGFRLHAQSESRENSSKRADQHYGHRQFPVQKDLLLRHPGNDDGFQGGFVHGYVHGFDQRRGQRVGGVRSDSCRPRRAAFTSRMARSAVPLYAGIRILPLCGGQGSRLQRVVARPADGFVGQGGKRFAVGSEHQHFGNGFVARRQHEIGKYSHRDRQNDGGQNNPAQPPFP